jgi:hypothetical protein
MSIRVGPCNWPLAHCGESDTGEAVCTSLGGLSADMGELIQEMAVGYLWNWTRKRFGTCSVTVRPCRESCWTDTTYRGPLGLRMASIPWYGSFYGGGSLNPALIGGRWFNLPCGSCGDSCSCGELERVELAGPVDAITQVRINGVVLDPTAYRVDNNSELIRVDGDRWPTCQDMSADPSTVGSNTFEVTYDIGVAVPAGGRVAAGVLACQMARAACGGEGCELPQRLQSITRQGVTMNVIDSFDQLYQYGSTGLWLVDAWVASVNQTSKGSRVWSPDVAPKRRTTWTG